MDHFQVFEKLQAAVGRKKTLRTRGKAEQGRHTAMSEENTPSGYLTRLARPEKCQGTNAAVRPVLRDQEIPGHIPGDGRDSCASSGELSAKPPSPRHHLADLTVLMARQKVEYESKIASLEQQSRALQSEIQGMRWKLGQQRKWYWLVEVKRRNTERAKEDAERRNEMLQGTGGNKQEHVSSNCSCVSEKGLTPGSEVKYETQQENLGCQ